MHVCQAVALDSTRRASEKLQRLRMSHRSGRDRNEPLERATGIEPASSAWEAEALPLSYARVSPPEYGPPVLMIRCDGGSPLTTRSSVTPRREVMALGPPSSRPTHRGNARGGGRSHPLRSFRTGCDGAGAPLRAALPVRSSSTFSARLPPLLRNRCAPAHPSPLRAQGSQRFCR